jgi:hypothetical protein
MRANVQTIDQAIEADRLEIVGLRLRVAREKLNHLTQVQEALRKSVDEFESGALIDRIETRAKSFS